MAAKRISKSAINWEAFAERVSKDEMQYLRALKARNDTYIRRIAAAPESLPKIDWNYYKSKISLPGLVANFQKEYEGLKIPYPTDQGLLAKIDEEEKEMKTSFVEFSKNMNQKKSDFEKKLATLEAQIPPSQMTVEEYMLANNISYETMSGIDLGEEAKGEEH